MTWWIISGIVYLLSVVYVYGSFKEGFRRYCEHMVNKYDEDWLKVFNGSLYDWKCEKNIIRLSILSPITLFKELVLSVALNEWQHCWPLKLCFRMPKKYCKK